MYSNKCTIKSFSNCFLSFYIFTYITIFMSNPIKFNRKLVIMKKKISSVSKCGILRFFFFLHQIRFLLSKEHFVLFFRKTVLIANPKFVLESRDWMVVQLLKYVLPNLSSKMDCMVFLFDQLFLLAFFYAQIIFSG